MIGGKGTDSFGCLMFNHCGGVAYAPAGEGARSIDKAVEQDVNMQALQNIWVWLKKGGPLSSSMIVGGRVHKKCIFQARPVLPRESNETQDCSFKLETSQRA